MTLIGRRAELAALVALCFFLPLYEAPKNLAWLAYALLWIANRARARDFGGAWDGWDTLIVLWLASVFVIAPFAAVHGGEWRAALDVVRYAGVLWLAKRSHYDEREWRWPLGALIVSAVLGVIVAYARLWNQSLDTLQLNSVGHVNHTAIYLAIVLGLCVSWFLAGGQAVPTYGAAVLFLVALFTAASRAAVGVGLALALALAIVQWRRARRRAALAVATVAVCAIVGVLGGAQVVVRQQALTQEGNTLNFRAPAWQLGLASWREHPWFGLGMDNFGTVTRAQDAAYGALVPHAHSLYLGTLVERGVVGAAPVAAVLIAWTWALWRRRPRAADGQAERLLWGAAASAWLVTVVAGTVNTTLHHEHGLLAALLLGAWLSRRPQSSVR